MDRGVILKLATPGNLQDLAFAEPELQKGVTFGRHPECTVTLSDNAELVSSRHAKLVIENDNLKIADLKSTNGTYLNGNRVEGIPEELHTGDVVSFGKTGPKLSITLVGFAGAAADVAETVFEAPAKQTQKSAQKKGEVTQFVDRIAGDKLATEQKQVIHDVAKEITASSRRARGGMLVVIILVLLGMGGVIAWQLSQTKDEIDETKQTGKKDADEARRAAEEARVRADEAKAAGAKAEEIAKRAETMMNFHGDKIQEITERLKALTDEQRASLDSFKTSFEASLKTTDANIQKFIDRREATEASWRELIKTYEPSVFLIFSSVPLAGDDGVPVDAISGFGTGWIADTDLVVTNKHVLYPHLFSAELMGMRTKAREYFDDPTIDWRPEQAFIAAWNHGTKFRKSKEVLDFESAWVIVPAGEKEKPKQELRVVYTPAHDLLEGTDLHKIDSSADLAVLHMRNLGKLKPLPILQSSGLKDIGPAQSVLALGYPRGAAAISGDTALTSPVTGAIRKNEWQVGVLSTSVPVIPGNSGGPLIDSMGRVIGVTSRGFETTQNDSITIDHVHRALDRARGLRRAW